MSDCHITAAGVLAATDDSTRLPAHALRVRRLVDDQLLVELLGPDGVVLAFLDPTTVKVGDALTLANLSLSIGIKLS